MRFASFHTVLPHIEWAKQWWDTRIERRKEAALNEVRAFAQHLAANPDYAARRQAVDHLLVQRAATPGANLNDLVNDPVVARLADLGIELRAPIRGISTKGRDNEFIVAIQEWAEPLRSNPFRGTAEKQSNPAWATPSPTQEDEVALARWEAAKVVYLYDTIPQEIRDEFLDVVVGLVCDQSP